MNYDLVFLITYFTRNIMTFREFFSGNANLLKGIFTYLKINLTSLFLELSWKHRNALQRVLR